MQNYISREKRTVLSHGLSDEEKKNTSDNFELHLELGNSRNFAIVLIGFLLPKQGYFRADYPPKLPRLILCVVARIQMVITAS